MQSTNEITIASDPRTIFKLGAEIENWPRLLPHYRSVTIRRQEGNRCIARMAASRDGIPVSWTCYQERDPNTPRILFRHTGGFTKGMRVVWTFEEQAGLTTVRIHHEFDKGWWPPFFDCFVSEQIVGQFFVANIAEKTLKQVKLLAERSPSSSATVDALQNAS